jgi:hypothetical protein
MAITKKAVANVLRLLRLRSFSGDSISLEKGNDRSGELQEPEGLMKPQDGCNAEILGSRSRIQKISS